MPSSPTTKAVILARGLGTRMRRSDPTAPLDVRQAAVAETGVKAMMPVGRPFLDYVLSTLADAGYREVCLVIGPEHDAVREYYTPQGGGDGGRRGCASRSRCNRSRPAPRTRSPLLKRSWATSASW